MPWWIFSVIALVAMSLYSVLFKKALNFNIGQQKILFYVFLLSLLGYIFLNSRSSALMPANNLTLYLAWGILVGALSVAGNLLEAKATKLSPNPGYVQRTKSANVLLILFASYLLFGARLNLQSLVGVVLIFGGLLMLLEPGKQLKEGQGKWRPFAIGAMFVFAAMILSVKQMSNLGFSPTQNLIVLFFFATLGFFFTNNNKRDLIKMSWPHLALILVLAAVAFAANLFNFTALKLTSNAGYSQAIFNSNAAFTTVLASLILPRGQGGEVNYRRWLGAFVVVLGDIIIAMSTG